MHKHAWRTRVAVAPVRSTRRMLLSTAGSTVHAGV